MGKSTLVPGFRFHPTDSELVMYYLKRKVLGKKFSVNAPIAEVDIYKFAPWDLPDKSYLKTGDLIWYFFCPIVKKYGKGGRLNRATVYGYWKTTGKDRPVEHNGKVVGTWKTLVFHQGKAPKGERTDWVMHEYKLEEKELADRGIVQDSYVLCEVFQKEGMGPRNGAQYGAPFKEEDWSDEEDETNLPGTGSLCGMSEVAVGGASSSYVLESLCVGPSVESSGLYTPPPGTACAATTVVHARPEVPSIANANAETVPAFLEAKGAQFARDEEPNGNISTLLDTFHADDAFLPYDGDQTKLPQVCDEDNDVALLLESFTEIDNPSSLSFNF